MPNAKGAKKTNKKDAQSKVKLMPVFPTWFGSHQWERTPSGIPINEFNDKLRLALYKMRANDADGIYRSNLAGTWHSKDTVLKECGDIGNELGKMFHYVMGSLASQHGADDGTYAWKFAAWCMMYRDRGYATPHTHPNCHFSGVYYLDTGADTDAELTMATGVRIKPGTFEAINTSHGNMAAPGLDLQPGFRISPRVGQMVAFPSWLPHFVHPVTGDHERICIACNGSVISHKEKSNDV